MGKIRNNSAENFLKSLLLRLDLKDADFNKLRNIIDRAQYDCCSVVTIYWVDTIPSAATPAAYQIRFKDVDGNLLAETPLSASNPYTLTLPQNIEVEVCNNVVVQVSNNEPGSGFTIEGSDGFSFPLTDDTVGEHCDSTEHAPNRIYIVSSRDGDQE